MKRLIGFAGFVALTISGCAASLLTDTPKNAIEQAVSCPLGATVKAEQFKILSTQSWPQGVVVLYSAFCPTADVKTPLQQVFGHKIVKRNGMAWQISGSGSYGAENESAPARLVEYGISRSTGKHQASSTAQDKESYTILYGRVLKPNVVAVEATFDNGKTIRDESTNGVFALLSAGATGVCALRVLGADNQILRQEDLVVQQLAQAKQATQCLPSQQS